MKKMSFLFELLNLGLEKSLDEFSIDSKEEYKDFINRINARLSTLTVNMN